jgi:NADH dehydrogenase FAD-containing subunit
VHGWCAAQVAKQQGQYLAKLISAGITPGKVPEGIAPFKYNHKGSLAYVGAPALSRSAVPQLCCRIAAIKLPV